MSAVTETTALLDDARADNLRRAERRPSLVGYRPDVDEEEAFAKNTDLETTWQAETKLLMQYSTPLVLTYLLQYSYNFVTVLVAGHLGTDELSASSLASMTAEVTGICVYEGLATCLDTLTSQAFGAGKKHLVGIHVQRTIALTILVTIPIGAVWICSPWILTRLVPEKEVAVLAGAFLRIYLVGAPGYGIFEAGKRFTQAQGNFTAPLVVLTVCAPLNLVWNWLFVFHLKLGFEGAALAAAFSLNLQPIVLALYVRFFAPSTLQCWPGLSVRRAFQNWGSIIKLAVPGVLMVVSEWLAFNILTFSSSYLSKEHLAAQSVLMTVSVTMYHIPFPISIAASTRFGNLIGYGALKAARQTFNTDYGIFFVIGVFDIVLLTSLRHVIAGIFTRDPVVRELIAGVCPIVAALQFVDATTALSNGLLRGLGRQSIGGYVNLGCYYLFAIPLSIFLTFGPPRLELQGLWIGPSIGLGLVSVFLYCYMRWSDWGRAVEEAQFRDE